MDIIEYKHSSLEAKISVLSTFFMKEHFNISNFTYNCRNPLKVIKAFLKI